MIAMAGWHRQDLFDDTGLPWVPPSPNLPTAASAYVYPGTCLFEGTNLSLGRGTTTPFEVIGAPWLDRRLAEHLRSLSLPGVAFRECAFTPAFDVHAGVQLAGVAVHVVDAAAVDPLRVALTMLTSIKRLYPGELTFGPTFDKLAGTDTIRLAIDDGAAPAEIAAGWSAGLIDFESQRRPHLLYKD